MDDDMQQLITVVAHRFEQVVVNNSGSLLRALIYTIGHFFIAATCVWYFTGASFSAAITDAVVEPILNGVWFFILDRYWTSRQAKKKAMKTALEAA
jgi:uncharacterized membrane protein